MRKKRAGTATSPKTMHRAAAKMEQFMRKYALFKYYSLDERIKYYNYVRNHIKNVNENSCLKPGKKSGYTIDDIIDLEHVISNEGFYGIIYKTSIKNMFVKYPIATKVMPDNEDVGGGNRNELLLVAKISNNILKSKLSRHFLLNYKNFYCNYPSDAVPDKVKQNKYLICLNELASGDFLNLCHASKSNKDGFLQNDGLILNTILQCILSIATFHKLGWLHFDAHAGNFLYALTEKLQPETKLSYYHYSIFGKNYYLKDCGITMMMHDFGLVQIYHKNKRPIEYDYMDDEFDDIIPNLKNIYYYDYRKFFSIFGNEDFRSVDLSPSITPFVDSIIESSSPDAFANENSFINYVCSEFASKYPDVFSHTLPAGEKVINKKPYIIDDTLEKKMQSPSLSPTVTLSASRQTNPASRSKSRTKSPYKSRTPPKSPSPLKSPREPVSALNNIVKVAGKTMMLSEFMDKKIAARINNERPDYEDDHFIGDIDFINKDSNNLIEQKKIEFYTSYMQDPFYKYDTMRNFYFGIPLVNTIAEKCFELTYAHIKQIITNIIEKYKHNCIAYVTSDDNAKAIILYNTHLIYCEIETNLFEASKKQVIQFNTYYVSSARWNKFYNQYIHNKNDRWITSNKEIYDRLRTQFVLTAEKSTKNTQTGAKYTPVRHTTRISARKTHSASGRLHSKPYKKRYKNIL